MVAACFCVQQCRSRNALIFAPIGCVFITRPLCIKVQNRVKHKMQPCAKYLARHLLAKYCRMEFLLYAFAGSLLIVTIRRSYQDVCVAFGLSLFALLCPLALWATILLCPKTYDSLFMRADLALRLNPLAVVTWTENHRLVGFLSIIYLGLPLAFGIAYAAERSMVMVRTALIAGMASFPLYILFPAIGPGHKFGPRNCMPSLHFSWALLLAWNAKSFPLRVFGWAFAAATGLATIGLGEHYFIDLFAAIPFCLGVQYAGTYEKSIELAHAS